MPAYTGATTGFAAGAETNASAVDYALETIYNQPPTGAYQAIRYTSISLAVNETESQPDEINDIPEMAQSVLLGRTTQGNIAGILSVGTYEDYLAGVMTSDWQSVSFASTASIQITLTKSNPSWNNLPTVEVGGTAGFTGISPYGGFITLSDPTQSLNATVWYDKVANGGHTIILPAGALDNAFSGTSPFKISTAGAVKCSYILNGKIGKLFTFRVPLASKWEIYSGTMVNQVQITLQKGQPATISVDLVGSDMTVSDTDIAASVTPRTSTPLINTIDGFLGCSIFGNAPAGCIQSATITLSRDGSGQDTGMGHVGACGIRLGSFKAAMEITYLFRDYQQFTDWKNGKTGPVYVGVQGSDGVGYQFTVLNGIIRNPKTPISGKNQTVVATVSVTANPVPGGGTFTITRIGV